MHYLALGDSISIDDYTGVNGGGAASQFARLIDAAGFDNRTIDGCTTDGVLRELDRWFEAPDVVTLTVGGNDLLVGLDRISGDWRPMAEAILSRHAAIMERLRALGCPVIVNTIYDPTDGQDEFAGEFGIPKSVRDPFNFINDGIRGVETGLVKVCDLERLFAGHGYWSDDPWIVGYIEPNHAGASAIAARWAEIFRSSGL